jgi:hypothetical protein
MKKQTPETAAPTTGDLINQLSNERLRLYRQSAGRPMPREVRARLVEIVKELDRLWDLRRQELASPPFVLPLSAPPAEPAAAPPPAMARPAPASEKPAPRSRQRVRVPA